MFSWWLSMWWSCHSLKDGFVRLCRYHVRCIVPGGPYIIRPRYKRSVSVLDLEVRTNLPRNTKIFIHLLRVKESVDVFLQRLFELIFENDVFPIRFLHLGPQRMTFVPRGSVKNPDFIVCFVNPLTNGCEEESCHIFRSCISKIGSSLQWNYDTNLHEGWSEWFLFFARRDTSYLMVVSDVKWNRLNIPRRYMQQIHVA